MYRALIVDDETYVVDWLSDLLESQTELELDVCRAYSAEEALDWMRRAKIDVVIADICMPEMNGIKLMEKINQNWPQCKVILLTAHAEFDYAYDAIKNNVVSYILKTEDDGYILKQVKKAIQLLDKELVNLQMPDDMHKKLKEPMSEIEREILHSILNNESKDIKNQIRQLGSIGAHIDPDKRFLLIIGRIENDMQDESIVQRFRKANTIKEIAGLFLNNYFYFHSTEYKLNRIVWLIQPKDDIADFKELESFTIAGRVVIFVKGMLEAVQQSCAETLGISMSFIVSSEMLDGFQIPDKFNELNRILNLHKPDNKGFIISEEAEGVLSNITVKFIKRYISEHITGDTSLVKLSEVTGYNSSYISRFFRESTGETLYDYISRQKVNKIKALMQDGSLNINDVAERAGFDSRTYFNRFMKKATNMSPQEFREYIRYG